MNLDDHKKPKSGKTLNIAFHAGQSLHDRWSEFCETRHLNGASMLRAMMVEFLDKEEGKDQNDRD